MSIKSKCRNCGKEVDSSLFKLHYKYKMMVCPDCFNGRTKQEEDKREGLKIQVSQKPAGWDHEDEYLSKYHKVRDQEEMKFKKIPGTTHVQCTCGGCKFVFKYDPFKKRPHNCPYCNKEVPKMNSFSML